MIVASFFTLVEGNNFMMVWHDYICVHEIGVGGFFFPPLLPPPQVSTLYSADN